ncbi:hypothetical protein [Microcystis aeruginosa]|uniref:hypothetical protein n=1 Tax=Microcystis aeruginosa TaxID=1126 RepID=UPI001D1482D6|nr:hypothetical protein [Microcystis aeruginosa]
MFLAIYLKISGTFQLSVISYQLSVISYQELGVRSQYSGDCFYLFSYLPRKEAKLTLTKRLYEQGYQREDILNLFKFIDWLMSLPAELEQEFQQELNQYEEEKRMPYITSVERMGMEKGMRESVIDALEIGFENVPSELVNKISQIKDTSLLKNLHRQAITLDSISDFQGYLNQLIKPENSGLSPKTTGFSKEPVFCV